MFGFTIFVFLSALCASISSAFGVLNEGDSCQFNNVNGVCKKIYDCPYAITLVDVEQKKPPMCRWQDTTRIVCCPTVDRSFLRNIKKAIEPESTTRRDYVPIQELEIPAEEPAECPALPRPELRTQSQHLAWSKCLDYQRFSNRCIPINKQKTIYKRVSTCVNADRSYDNQILGGYPALPMEFPHLAVLGFKNKYGGEITWNGAGTLISEKFILTAAHILNDFGEVQYAMMGALNKTDINSGAVFNVIRAISYSDYGVDSKKDDIVLLELKDQIMFNEYIHPACLPVPDRKLELERIVAGWGETNGREEQPNILLTTNVIENARHCLARFNRNVYDRKTMKCVKGKIGDNSVFKGDSGGPLMALLSNLKCSYSIEGIASKTPEISDSIHIYTNVSKYLDWIVQNIWPDEWTNAKSSGEG